MSITQTLYDQERVHAPAQWLRRVGGIVAVVLGGLMLAWLISHDMGRAALAASIFFVLVGLALVRPQIAIGATLILLTFVGDLRRLLIPLLGWSGQDPLLLVGPAMAALLLTVAVVKREATLDTPISRWVVVLMGIMALQVLNPRQGGLAVGLAGVLFYGIPLFWFWVGRTYLTKGFLQKYLLYAMVPMAVLAAVLGLYQAFFGYLPHQQMWYDVAGYTALSARGTLRPISFFTSAGEYVSYLTLALVVVWASALKGQRALLILAPLFLIAIFFGASRGPIVISFVTATVLWALMGRTRAVWLPRLAVAAVIGGIGFFFALQKLNTVQVGGSTQNIVEHVVGGLSNPLDQRQSTAVLHSRMFVYGIKSGFTNPIGMGLGATSLASRKFGGATAGSEKDISDMFISLGAIGGIVYVIIVCLVILTAVRYWQRRRSLLALALAALFIGSLTQWLNGGFYAISPLIWLCIGAMDQFNRDDQEEAEEIAYPAPAPPRHGQRLLQS